MLKESISIANIKLNMTTFHFSVHWIGHESKWPTNEAFERQDDRNNTRFIDDGVDLLHYVKIGLIVGVFDSGASPRHHWQLACGELFANIGAAWKTEVEQM